MEHQPPETANEDIFRNMPSERLRQIRDWMAEAEAECGDDEVEGLGA